MNATSWAVLAHGVLPDYRPVTPDTPAKARDRGRKRERYWQDPETHRAQRRVENLSPAAAVRARALSRRKYRTYRSSILERQAKLDRQRGAALRILRAVLATLDGQPMRMRNRTSKYS
jgi:hypothetical protein